MRLLKDTEIEYRPFFSTTNYAESETDIQQVYSENYKHRVTGKNKNELEMIVAYERELEKTYSVLEATEKLNRFLVQNLNINSAQLYFFDKTKTDLNPLGVSSNGNFASFVRHLNSEGSIDWVFENQKNEGFPELMTYTVNGNNTKLIIIPIVQKNRKKGILLLTATAGIFTNNETNYNLVRTALSFTLNKIETLLYRQKAKEVVKELQLYQSKVKNDHRVLAVGEMAIGAVEGILNPMQVIMSYVEMIANENSYSNPEAVKIIKEQVGEVTKIISGLMKFANRDKESTVVQPVDLNEIIKEYHKIVSSTLSNKNCELVLDLQKNIPEVISNRDYIFQLLTNVFALMLSGDNDDGGILLQTKHEDDFTSIRIISTNYLKSLDNKIKQVNPEISLTIIKKLMDKHQGNFRANSNKTTGSSLTLNFPLHWKK